MYQRIFVRHLFTDKNSSSYDTSPDLQKKVRSRRNARLPVNAEGHAQGKRLEESFARYLILRGITGPVAFIHSDLERTRTTAGYLQKSLESENGLFDICRFKGDKRIRDIDHGLANDLPYETMRRNLPDYAREIDAVGYLDARPPRGESHRDALPRVKEFLDSLDQFKCHVVVVTHLSTLILIRSILENLPDEKVLDMLSGVQPPNASLTRYHFDPETRWWMLAEADVLPWKTKILATEGRSPIALSHGVTHGV